MQKSFMWVPINLRNHSGRCSENCSFHNAQVVRDAIQRMDFRIPRINVMNRTRAAPRIPQRSPRMAFSLRERLPEIGVVPRILSEGFQGVWFHLSLAPCSMTFSKILPALSRLLGPKFTILFAWYKPHFGPPARNRKNIGFGLPRKNRTKWPQTQFLSIFWAVFFFPIFCGYFFPIFRGRPKPTIFLFFPISGLPARDGVCTSRVHAKGVVLCERTCFCLLSTF